MLFKPELCDLILRGVKTQTRRIDKGDEWLHMMYSEPDMTVWRGGRILWQTGRTYAVQPGRGKHAIGRIKLTQIRYCARARDISAEDARAEGFESPAAFCETYGRLNGAAALDAPCWALSFVLVEE